MILGEIVEDFDRNELIINEIQKLEGRKTLILSERDIIVSELLQLLKNKTIDEEEFQILKSSLDDI